MITFENVSKDYNGSAAVHSINLEIKKGEFFVIIGPSGCGKTTLLKMINRLIDLSAGTIRINDRKISEYDIHELRWDIGYVLQQIALFPHMTIEENISIVPELKKWSEKDVNNRVDELLEMVGLEPKQFRKRKPAELSGGQQQRIGVIRALASNPETVLMDEPFSALDPISREKLQEDLLMLQKKIKKTIVFVTHDMKEALKLGDRICVMKDGEILQVGTPAEIIHNPVNSFVRNFVGEEQTFFEQTATMNSLKEYIIAGSPQNVSSVTVPISATLGEALNYLSIHESIAVENSGETIGSIDRRTIIAYLNNQLQERGKADE